MKRLADRPAAGHIKSQNRITSETTITMGVGASAHLDALRGKRVCISIWIKTSNVENWAGLECVVIGADNKVWALDDMGDRPITGSTDWHQCKVVIDVPKEATLMYALCELHGNGELWYDDTQINIVGSDVPITDNQTWRVWSQTAPKYSAAADPNIMYGGHPAICISSSTASRSQWGCYDHYDRSPAKYLGHQIRMTAWMKCENVTKDGSACGFECWGRMINLFLARLPRPMLR